MTAPVIEGARQTVAAPTRRERRFGLFSIVEPIDGGDSHWILGGLTADGEECSQPLFGDILCGPTPDKVARSWYSDIEGDPWLAYMYETCKTPARFYEAAAKLRARFLAAEQSAVEYGLFQKVLDYAPGNVGSFDSVAQAIGVLEAEAASVYGGQVTLLLPPTAAAEASSRGLLIRVGDHLETVTGSLVAVGYFGDVNPTNPMMFATGGITLYRGPLTTAGPVFDMKNDYYALVERPYAALVDCLNINANGAICPCPVGAP